jgi:hypothetical protein
MRSHAPTDPIGRLVWRSTPRCCSRAATLPIAVSSVPVMSSSGHAIRPAGPRPPREPFLLLRQRRCGVPTPTVAFDFPSREVARCTWTCLQSREPDSQSLADSTACARSAASAHRRSDGVCVCRGHGEGASGRERAPSEVLPDRGLPPAVEEAHLPNGGSRNQEGPKPLAPRMTCRKVQTAFGSSASPIARGPWLCVPASRQVCPSRCHLRGGETYSCGASRRIAASKRVQRGAQVLARRAIACERFAASGPTNTP